MDGTRGRGFWQEFGGVCVQDYRYEKRHPFFCWATGNFGRSLDCVSRVDMESLSTEPVSLSAHDEANQICIHNSRMTKISEDIQRDVPTRVGAFDRSAKKHLTWKLAIVGGGDLCEEIKRLAQNCVARDPFLVPGLDRPEKWLAWADCFV